MTTSAYDTFRIGRRPTAFVPELKSRKTGGSRVNSPFAAITAIFRRFVAAIARANQRKVLYQQLDALDDHLLADIGIRRTEIARIVAESYRTDATAPQAQAVETQSGQSAVEEVTVEEVLANDNQARRAA